VLANEHLRATFLLGLGGRLWSLVHRPSGRELLYTNPIFQPAHLALRNAWFAGGVEWNIGTIGHTPLTCEPMHAALVRSDDGGPVLRMYEFERLRRVVYQIDVHLPPDSPVLVVHVRITNPNAHQVPMYWWSNIAVPQTPGTRVLAPADRAWNYSYGDVVRHDPVTPRDDALDVTYPARFPDAADHFFDLAGAAQPWIAAVDAEGHGMFQTSTRELSGRKLFRWGTGPGGRRWQEWLSGPLSEPTAGYVEIQAGLARTQFEHLPMPAEATWSWTEAYGPLDAAAADVHGDWSRARSTAAHLVTAAVPAERLAQWQRDAERIADRAPESLLHTGSGWGALDGRLRARAGEPPLDRAATPFPDTSLGTDQQPWLALLDTGAYPDPAPGEFPPSVHLHPHLEDLLAASPGWAAPALLGVILARGGDIDGASDACQNSVRREDNPYARRNLAVLAAHQGRLVDAAEEYERALELGPPDRLLVVEPLRAAESGATHPALLIEALRAFIAAGQAHRALVTIDGLPVDQRGRGRIRLLEATAALAAGDLDRCGAILSDQDLAVADLREGEDSLDQLWWDYRAALTAADRGIEPDEALREEIRRTVRLPAHLDFRMHP
jgi:tetratricopeptide (TPR) repeat protein